MEVQPWFYNAVLDYFDRTYGAITKPIAQALYRVAFASNANAVAVDVGDAVARELGLR